MSIISDSISHNYCHKYFTCSHYLSCYIHVALEIKFIFFYFHNNIILSIAILFDLEGVRLLPLLRLLNSNKYSYSRN